MATWNIGTGNALAAQVWSAQLIIEAADLIAWAPYMGMGPNNFIQVKEDLMKKPGEIITFGLVKKLTGSGVTGDSTLEGNEEAPSTFTDTVTLDQKRNAIRINGAMSEQRSAFSQRETAKDLLKIWLAETIDGDIMTDMTTSPTRVLYQGTATSTATLTAADLFDLNLINKAKVLSRTLSPKIVPVQRGSRKLHLAIFHPDSEYDMQVESSVWTAAQQFAMPDGPENAMFTDALGFWRNTILLSSENIPTASTWGSGANLNGAENIFCGRQAGCFAWGMKPFWREKEFDYGNQVGFAVGAIYDHTKAIFNSEDHAVIGTRSTRTNIVEG